MFKEIENFNLNNIFLINKIDLKDVIESNPLVENYFIFRRYPSSLDINIEKTKFLAKINKNGKIFFIGSNRKLIQKNYLHNQLPFVFGNPELIDFFNIKEIIDKSKISYSEIKNLYFFPSKRWDLRLKNNTLVKLPRNFSVEHLNDLYKFLENYKIEKFTVVDARINNQIILNE